MASTQNGRHISLTTPLGANVLLLQSFTGYEGLSRLFSLELELLSEVEPALKFDSIVGKNVTIAVKHATGTRHFNGIVQRFSQGAGDPTFASYRAQIVPTLWLLTQTANCRIFQKKTVPAIIQEVLRAGGVTDVRLDLTKTYAEREYCVQYRETDFNFISRLMEQYGIYYFFKHEVGKHTVVLGDAPGAHTACTKGSVKYQGTVGATLATAEVITELTKHQEIRPSKYSLTDYNFTTPSAKLGASVDSLHPAPGGATLEVYDYPGEYETRGVGSQLAKLRIEEEEAQREIVHGTSGCRALTAGHRFQISGHPRKDLAGTFVLLSVRHSAAEHGYHSNGGGEPFVYSNSFECMPSTIPFRPPRLTPRPFVQGAQTARVVGPKGDEIYSDPHGRVKVQFHWDRLGTMDEKSSCWIRVSSPWAGQGWGGIAIPRIGQEVVVDFIEGDPDQPIITGRVYNAEQRVPYSLPAEQTKSTMKSNSTPGGGGFNELRFEDKKGSEQIFLHGEKDVDIIVKNERRESVGATQHLTVAKSRIESIGADDNLKVATDKSEEIGGDLHVKVTGNHNEDTGSQHSVKVGTDLVLDAGTTITGTAGQQIYLKGGMKVVIEAATQLTIKGPGGFVSIDPSGVTIQGTLVKINSGGSAGSGSAKNAKAPKAPKAPKKAMDKPA